MQTKSSLVLEDGTVFPGISVGAPGVAAGEACFTTAMTGYEEAVTDPSYVAQVLCFSYPLIGTYGVDESRMESDRVQCEGVVMRDVRPEFAAWLREQGVVALTGLDTRTLVRKIRDGGVLRCALGDAPVDELQAKALSEPYIDGRPLDRQPGAKEATRSVPGLASSSSTSGRSARSPGGSPTRGSRRTSCRAHGTPRRSSTRIRGSS